MKVIARAPGKIILSGEHAVVHGSTAVAASINLHTSASLHFPSDNGDTLKLELKDMNLKFSWSMGRIKEVLPGFDSPTPSTPKPCSGESLRSLATLVDEQMFPEAKIALASGVSAFLWLYINIQGYKPATVTVTSQIPLSSGLGSSAAFCVSISGALLAFSSCGGLDHNQQGWLMFEESGLELVNKWALEGERIIHGKPSGIDNTVSTYVPLTLLARSWLLSSKHQLLMTLISRKRKKSWQS